MHIIYKCILEARELLPEMQYLLAKACMDLGEYGQAEEALLEQVRIQFRQARTEHDKLDMDEWILNSTVSIQQYYSLCIYFNMILIS